MKSWFKIFGFLENKKNQQVAKVNFTQDKKSNRRISDAIRQDFELDDLTADAIDKLDNDGNLSVSECLHLEDSLTVIFESPQLNALPELKDYITGLLNLLKLKKQRFQILKNLQAAEAEKRRLADPVERRKIYEEMKKRGEV